MTNHAYTSLNKALRQLWVTTSGLAAETMVTRQPVAPAEMPIPGLRISWLKRGESTGITHEEEALVQLSLFVPNQDEHTANTWAKALNEALGVKQGFARLAVYDYDQEPPLAVAEGDLRPLEGGWVTVGDPDPTIVHLAQTFTFTTRPLL